MADKEVKLRPAVFEKVDSLNPTSQGTNLKVKVLSADTVMNKKHPDGTKIRIAETLVGDDTARILFSARNEQIDVAKPGSYILIRNSKIKMFKGFMRLTVDKWGLVEEDTNPESFEVAEETENLSLIEYELVRQ